MAKADLQIQIIGTRKCAETRKAERFFKERGVRAHFRDLADKALAAGELDNIQRVVGGWDALLDRGSREFETRNLRYYGMPAQTMLQKYPLVMHTPVVRNGRKATVGHAPVIWQSWIDEA